MAKNRKSQSAAIRFGPVLKVVLMCSVICGSAIGYVWQKDQINRLAEQCRVREKGLEKIKRDNESLGRQISILHSTVMLDRRAKELNIGLVPAQPQQMVRLVETPVALVNNSPRQFARRPANSLTP